MQNFFEVLGILTTVSILSYTLMYMVAKYFNKKYATFDFSKCPKCKSPLGPGCILKIGRINTDNKRAEIIGCTLCWLKNYQNGKKNDQ